MVSLNFTACSSFPSRSNEPHAQYSHTELTPGKHFLAYHGPFEMTLEIATEKWLGKAERLCGSREFDYELDKEEMRGESYAKYKYPYIEGEIICPLRE